MKTYMAAAVVMVGASARAQDCPGWVERHADVGPGGVAGQAMVYDSARKQSVLYDGNQGANARETWGWDGSAWTLLTKQCPTAQSSLAMAYDSGREVAVLFGGAANGVEWDETWEWDGDVWHLADGADPDNRESHAMAFDSARAVTVLFGGYFMDQGDPFYLNDTWEWNGQIWTQRLPDHSPPPMIFHCMAYDAARGVTVLYGGDGGQTWEWDGQTWTERAVQGPGFRAGAGLVYDSDRGVCVLFGGGTDNHTWQWDGDAWTQIKTQVAPSIRGFHAMSYDSQRHSVVLFGGRDENGQLLDDTWEFVCASPCAPDLDGSGTLDLFDFLCFVNGFNQGC